MQYYTTSAYKKEEHSSLPFLHQVPKKASLDLPSQPKALT